MIDRVPTHQRGLGVAFQDSRLLPGRTVENNLNFATQRAPPWIPLDYMTLVEAWIYSICCASPSTASRAVSVSASRWRVRYWRDRGCCCWTNPLRQR
ncbi:MAG: hypothetical protein CM15mP74_18550 [Halieaceae bacterium]|nr:MAG: hypothetical protein CM15mP74_18550 [Halieaceae bacterium]